ncbi:hypothetical protein [Cytobacillus kochii]|uniref:hypothetical protein n=1 Tax=Cytobacillus kochii TaxID=859143 RepID=UPI00402A9688
MTGKKIYSFGLLIMFCAFLVVHYPSDHSSLSTWGDHQHAVFNDSHLSDTSPLKDELKKHPLVFEHVSLILISLLLLGICQLAYVSMQNSRHKHPIFFQSNYL